MGFPEDNLNGSALVKGKVNTIKVAVGYDMGEGYDPVVLPVVGKTIKANFIYTKSSTPLVRDTVILKDNRNLGGVEISSEADGVVTITLNPEDLDKVEIKKDYYLYLLLQDSVLLSYFGSEPRYVDSYLPLVGNKYLYEIKS